MHAARGGMEGKFRKGCQKLAEEGGLARQLSKQFSLATVPDPAAKAKLQSQRIRCKPFHYLCISSRVS